MSERLATVSARVLGQMACAIVQKCAQEQRSDLLDTNYRLGHASINEIFEMCSEIGVGTFSDTGLELDDQAITDAVNDLILEMSDDSELVIYFLATSQVSVRTKAFVMQENLLTCVGVALVPLQLPAWAYWCPCNYPLSGKGFLKLGPTYRYGLAASGDLVALH